MAETVSSTVQEMVVGASQAYDAQVSSLMLAFLIALDQLGGKFNAKYVDKERIRYHNVTWEDGEDGDVTVMMTPGEKPPELKLEDILAEMLTEAFKDV